MTAADRARASREAQGLPATVTDPAVLARVAALVHAVIEPQPSGPEAAA